MKRLLLGGFGAVVLGVASSAYAADMPMKAVAPPPLVLGWTGLYVGVNGGYAVGSTSFTQSSTFTSTALGTNSLLNANSHNSMNGALFGGQIGYNWQFSSPWLLGVEADSLWRSQIGSSSFCAPASGTVAFFGAGGSALGNCLNTQQKISDFGTARARGGAIVNDSLWYATGGLAWGRVHDTYTASGSVLPAIFPGAAFAPGLVNGGGAFSSTKVGWTVGAGVETKLAWRGWSAKLEYLHVDLGSRTETVALGINPAFGAAFTAGGVATATSNTHITDDMIRLGLNYKIF